MSRTKQQDRWRKKRERVKLYAKGLTARGNKRIRRPRAGTVAWIVEALVEGD